MKKKLDLNIRQLAKDGKISNERMGQLLALDAINSAFRNSVRILSDDDENVIRKVGDSSILNKYINGGNAVLSGVRNLRGEYSGMKYCLEYSERLCSDFLLSAVLEYVAPSVRAVSPEKYKKIGLERREKRLKRKYTPRTVIALAIQEMLFFPSDEEKKSVGENLKSFKKVYHEEDRYTDSLEGIICSEINKQDSSELIEAIMKRISKDFAPVASSLNIKTKADLDKVIDETVTGELLAKCKEAKHLQEMLVTPESYNNILDDYDDEDDDMGEDGYSKRRLFETYDETFAIIADMSKFTEGGLEDDYLTDGEYARPLTRGTYSLIPPLGTFYEHYKKESVGYILAQRNILTVRCNMKLASAQASVVILEQEWLNKALELLGAEKSEAHNLFSIYDDIQNYELRRLFFLYRVNSLYLPSPKHRELAESYKEAIIPLWAVEGHKLNRRKSVEIMTCLPMAFEGKSDEEILKEWDYSDALFYVLNDKKKYALELAFSLNEENRKLYNKIQTMTISEIPSVLNQIIDAGDRTKGLLQNDEDYLKYARKEADNDDPEER